MHVHDASASKPTIAVVDDTAANRRLYGCWLDHAGFEVVEAGSGAELEALLGRVTPHLVVLDVNLPDADGREICRRLKRDERLASVPVLVVSATAIQFGDRIEAVDDGPDAYLVTPVPYGEFIAVVRSLVRIGMAAASRERQLRAAIDAHRAAEQRFSGLVQGAPDALLGVDSEGRVTFVNRRAETLFGDTAHCLVHRAVTDLLPGLLAMDGARGPLVATSGRRRDGRMFPAEVMWAGLPGESVLSVRDVTERQRVEDERHRTQQLMRTILEHAPLVIVVKDLDGRYLLASATTEAYTGVRPADLLGRTAADVLREPLSEELARHEHEVIATGQSIQREYVLPHTDGTLHSYEFVRFPLRTADGAVYATCGIGTDVTDKRAAAERERHFYVELERARRLESLGQLAGGVAHDFNNLLAVILNFTDFAASTMKAAGLADAEVVSSVLDDLATVGRAAQSASTLTQQLLTFAGRQSLRPEILDLNERVGEIESLLGRTLGEDIDWALDLAADLWNVLIDPGAVELILLNLAVNARDAMAGGGVLRIFTENLDLDVAAARGHEVAPGRWVHVGVADSGVGMDGDVAARAFEPFFTTKGSGRGTGLGLATVYGAVAAAGGHVRLESAPGRGTTAHVYLPAYAGSSTARPVEPATPREHGTETVLLVEDEPAVRAVGTRILRAAGYDVVDVESGREAVALLEGEREIDLVVTDVVMPEMSGPELVVHSRALRPDVPVLFVSGYPADVLARRQPYADLDGPLLPKPFTATMLLQAVRRTLDGDRSDAGALRRS